MAETTPFTVPKLTIIFPPGDQLTSVLLEKEKHTVVADLIERTCSLRGIDLKNIRALNDLGKKIDTKQTVEQSGLVFIELIDKKNKNKDAEKPKSVIQESENSHKIKKGAPAAVTHKIGHLCELPLRQQLFDEEWESLQDFKAKHGDVAKNFSDEFLMSSLWARKFDYDRTIKLLQLNIKWRKDNGLEHIPKTSEIEHLIKAMKLSWQIPGARDKKGGGIYYMIFTKDIVFGQEPFSVPNIKKWILWYYTVGIFHDGLDGLRNGYTIIEDLAEFGWNHFDIDTQKQLNTTEIFPLRFSRVVVINPPAIFNAIVKVCKTFMKAKFLDRFETTTKPKDVLNYVDTKNLSTKFGGEIEYDGNVFAEKIIEFGKKHDATLGVSLN